MLTITFKSYIINISSEGHKESEEMKMKEYTHICKSEQEAEEGINNLARAGFKRTQNCYWIEWWEKDNCRHIIVREF